MFVRLVAVLVFGFTLSSRAQAEEACEDIQVALVCEARFPWKRVDDFPFANFKQKPTGDAVAFHLDGRGIGVIARADARTLGSFYDADNFADFFVSTNVLAEGSTQVGPTERSVGEVNGNTSEERRVVVNVGGREMVFRGSFVNGGEDGLLVYSFLNQKIDSQVGAHLQKGLVAAVSLQEN
jgi:hypothetical protein